MMAQAKANRNWFAIWVSVAVVVVIVGVGAAVVWMNNVASSPGEPPQSAIVNPETGAISVGDGPDTVALYQDFMCPHCQDFDAIAGPTLTQLVDDGSITLELHPVALANLDSASGTKFSTRSANAMYCVAETSPDAVLAFSEAVFATSPTPPGATDEELIALASSVGAGDITECVTNQTYAKFVAAMTKTLPMNPATGSAGTPALLVNGEFVPVTGNVQADIVDRLNG